MQVTLRTSLFLLAGFIAAVSPAVAKSTAEAAPGTPDGDLLIQARAIFGKLPASMPGSEKDTPAMVALGKKLYFEKAISINKTQSCNSCHPLGNKGAGADNLKTGKGAEGKSGDRNDPSTMNAGFQIAQFWDGRAATLEDQAKGPPRNPIEMGMADGEAVAKRLKEIGHYPADFKKAFPGQKDPVTFDNFAKAVAAFERTLISRGRLDRYIDGDAQALTDQEKQGMRTFIQARSVVCSVTAAPTWAERPTRSWAYSIRIPTARMWAASRSPNWTATNTSSRLRLCAMSPLPPLTTMMAR